MPVKILEKATLSLTELAGSVGVTPQFLASALSGGLLDDMQGVPTEIVLPCDGTKVFTETQKQWCVEVRFSPSRATEFTNVSRSTLARREKLPGHPKIERMPGGARRYSLESLGRMVGML